MSKPKRHYRVMTARSQIDWLRLLWTVEDRRLRMKLAAIIWWDWYGLIDVEVKGLRREFNKLRDEDNNRPNFERDIFTALVEVFDYSEREAKLRSVIPASKQNKGKYDRINMHLR